VKILDRIRRKSLRRVIGLMSGTSADGVDAALVEIREKKGFAGAALTHALTLAYSDRVRGEIREIGAGNVEALCALNTSIGSAFADAALKLIEAAGLEPSDCDLIGSHGQTVCHLPERGATFQIGEAAVIVERTGIPTVSDFRSADMAAGGMGAPLVPLADYYLFRPSHGVRLLLNIGGIANLTLLTPEREGVRGFDTGPGNALIDAAVSLFVGRGMTCDRDGEIARKGRIDGELMAELMAHPFLSRKPPKSTGLEVFGRRYVEELRGRFGRLGLEDFISTLTAFSARSVGDEIRRIGMSPDREDILYIGGGGVHNRYLMELLGQAVSPLRTAAIDDLGIPADYREAVAFAILANETIEGRPGNLTAVTGARRAVVLGKISLPF